ncbi:MAG: zinc/iron permease [Thermoleophilia bacterium]|jgi:zinc transporter ZupT|nr:zinc/iron permease [Thermoleophilia bacterium]
MLPFFFAFLAAAGFFAATLAVETTLGRSRRVQVLAMLVSAGILLGLAFADLMPEAFELAGHGNAAIAIAVGFLALYAIETLTSGHTHHLEPHAHGHGHGHAHSHAQTDDPGCIPPHAILPFLIGLGLHNFADGVVIGASDAVSDGSAAAVAAGIFVHQLPVGLSFAAVLIAGGLALRRINRDAVIVAAMIPLGATVVTLLPNLSDGSLGVLIGIAAGALLYIATGHLLPEAHSEERHLAAAATFAVALVATILLVTALHGDEHDAHEAEAHEAERTSEAAH